MKKVTIIGVDLAKHVFQVHGAATDGSVVFRRKLSRPQFRRFMAEQPTCIVAMEACATAHYWGRQMVEIGHDVRLIAPIYVKPFVKRQKNDAADAEAIVEAALRPNMRFVPLKSAQTQAHAMLFRAREQLSVSELKRSMLFGAILPSSVSSRLKAWPTSPALPH